MQDTFLVAQVVMDKCSKTSQKLLKRIFEFGFRHLDHRTDRADQYAENNAEWSGDENAEEGTLIRLRRDNDGTNKAGRRTDPSKEESVGGDRFMRHQNQRIAFGCILLVG